MKKKVILVQAAQMEGEKVRKVEKSYIVSRTMPYLAALFSEYSHGEWEVVLIDDYLKGERLIDETADLYAITAMAATLGRAIQIGEILKCDIDSAMWIWWLIRMYANYLKNAPKLWQPCVGIWEQGDILK